MSKRVLVTGAAGFIGARLSEALIARGTEVVGCDELEHFEKRAFPASLDFVERVDRADLLKWLASPRGIEAVFHIGARTDTQELDTVLLGKLNTQYSQDLWSWASQAGIPFVYASSAATYGAGELGYSDDPALIPKLKPLNPYGQSKQDFDLWVLGQTARQEKSPPRWAGFKFFNVYGFGEAHKGFMSSVILHARDEILARGHAELFKSYRPDFADGMQKRDFVAVEDVVNVLLHAAEAPRFVNGIYNLGTGNARSFVDLARAVFKALGRPEKIQYKEMPEALRPRYQYFTQAEMGRLREAGYQAPFLSLEDGVARYVKRLAAGS